MKIKQISHFKSHYGEELFGSLPSNEAVYQYTLANKNGMQMQVINYGATITGLKMTLKSGEIVDVVLGFDSLDAYIDSFGLQSPPYFGATIGRFAGRINEGEFVLNDEKIVLHKNNGNHSLHGGAESFSQKIWSVKNINKNKNPSITFTHVSPDGEENYPGELQVDLTYTLSEDNELSIEYVARTTKDTVVNLTHHSYFNLDGHDSNVLEQELIVNSIKTLQKTNESIPTGWILNIANFPFDFSSPKSCPEIIDTTFVLHRKEEFAASLFNKKNKLKMSVYTNQPAVHIYVGGNCFGEIKGKENANYHPTSGICFETQNYPDAPNHGHFPSSILKENELYYHKTIYKFQSF